MRGLTPVPDDPREGISQQNLFTTLHEKPAILRKIPWESKPNRRGVLETNELERQALINDFEFHGIPVQVRIADPDVLRSIYGPDATELRIVGPGRLAWAMPNQRIPDEEYVITAQWRDFPAFFANWLNHRAAEDPLIGAAWTKMIKVRSKDENGEESVRYRGETHPPRRLLAWRTQADLAEGERASGLVVPSSARVPAFLADGDETGEGDETAEAGPAPSAVPAVAGRRR